MGQRPEEEEADVGERDLPDLWSDAGKTGQDDRIAGAQLLGQGTDMRDKGFAPPSGAL